MSRKCQSLWPDKVAEDKIAQLERELAQIEADLAWARATLVLVVPAVPLADGQPQPKLRRSFTRFV